jgi:uncharacterized protein involved in high-affinity Fe2+ transport
VSHAPIAESGKRLTPAGKASEPKIPPGKLSEEASAIQLQLSRSQGKTEEDALFYLSNNSYGGEMMAGPYRVAFLIEKPKGYYQLANGQLEWQAPSGDAFLSIVVRDGYDGRTVPYLDVKINMVNEFSKSVEKKTLPFGWFPLLNRYGDNVDIGRNGNYVLMVEIVPPTFSRQDHVNGNRFTHLVKAEFEHLRFQMQDLQEPVREDNKAEWLPLAKAQGKAVKLALENMMYSTAIDGSAVQKGDYLLAYAIEYAKGDWNFRNGILEYESRIGKSTEMNSYVEVAVMDALTGRFLPGLEITSSLFLENDPISTSHPDFKWHPWIYHYGKNIRVPRNSKEYTLKIQATPPTYRRYGNNFGKIMDTAVEFSFQNVDIKTGQK